VLRDVIAARNLVMKPRANWRVISVLTGFLGITAVAGGIGLTSGSIAPEVSQLDGSPFGSYLVPGMVLLGIGIVSLTAAGLCWRQTPRGARLSLVAGTMIMAYELVQIVYIDLHWLQPAYFLLGMLILVLATVRVLDERGETPRHA
jgi:hypothetical protein